MVVGVNLLNLEIMAVGVNLLLLKIAFIRVTLLFLKVVVVRVSSGGEVLWVALILLKDKGHARPLLGRGQELQVALDLVIIPEVIHEVA